MPGVISAVAFGAGLHVRTEVETPSEGAMRGALTEAGAQVREIERIGASLEDVFVAAADAGAEAAIRAKGAAA